MLELKGKYNTAKVFTDIIEETAIGQIIELCNQEFTKDSKIRIMPDVHAGAGCTIGTTMTIKDKIVPNLVGVDIGCGVFVVPLKKGVFDLQKLDEVIRTYIPSGASIRKNPHEYADVIDFDKLKCINSINLPRAINSIGTLGGGNHFIEVNIDEYGKEYLVIHSGSRNFGKQVAEHYQNIAYQECLKDQLSQNSIIADLKSQGRVNEIESTLQSLKLNKVKINKDLAYLSGESLNDYLHDIAIVQEYAMANRSAIAMEILSHMGIKLKDIDTTISTIHNYIDLEKMILRKGAVSAKRGEKLIIPINMRDGSLICIGKGNEDWNYSAPHGAGRLMSRSEAKKKILIEDYEREMKNIYSTSVNTSTLDEAPMAYKNKEDIINNISATVEICNIITPIYNFKASE